MKNFNWKKFAVRVPATWILLAFVIGFVSDLKINAQDTGWHLLFKVEGEKTYCYLQKNSLTISENSNPVVTIRLDIENFGTIYSRREFDCKNKRSKRIRIGKSVDSMQKIDTGWEVPTSNRNSAFNELFKTLCYDWR